MYDKRTALATADSDRTLIFELKKMKWPTPRTMTGKNWSFENRAFEILSSLTLENPQEHSIYLT